MRKNPDKAKLKGEKILFLDIDGVVIPSTRMELPDDFDEGCVNALKKIITETGAKIVLSSTWRYEMDLLSPLLEKWGLPEPVATTSLTHSITSRATEIISFVQEHKIAENDWIALDDDKSVKKIGKNAILTDATTGLTMKDAEKAIKKLQS